MIYIDFYCDKSDLARWRQWCTENDIDDDEEECRTGYIERGAGVMDYYFRLLCIAAYRRISNSLRRISKVTRGRRSALLFWMCAHQIPQHYVSVTKTKKRRRRITC